MKTSRILITGASGFVGSNLARSLLLSRHNVHIILRRNANVWRIKDILPYLSVHKVNLLHPEKLKSLLEDIQPDYIFHLAAHGAYSYQTNVQEMIQTNIVSLSHLLEASKDIPYKCFVNTGSSSEYGYKQKPMKETDILEPTSFYAATKSSATLLSQVFAHTHNKPIVTFRLFSVYGPYEDPSRLIPTAMKSALTNKTLGITSGSIKRDFIYVKDVVNAYLSTMKHKVKRGGIYNIGTGRQASNDDIATIIKSLNKGKLDIRKGGYPNRSWDTSYWVANTTHTKKELRWKPDYTLRRGLEETYQWFSKNQQLYEKI